MRLLDSRTNEFREFVEEELPPYAILSHTWGDEEVTFQDMFSAARFGKPQGWQKVELCCHQALEDGLDYVWIDTCCIDKSSSTELQEAINSMFRWYQLSTECYAFLTDFEIPEQHADNPACEESSAPTDSTFRSQPWRQITSIPVNMNPRKLRQNLTVTDPAVYVTGLERARWFTRGWTLQELLAPESIRFFDAKWREFGDKISLRGPIASITGIREDILLSSVLEVRTALDSVCIAQRMSWAANRTTKRVEDIAYCLLGIFDINMPLLYGEGAKAFQRLQEEIMKVSTDQSILAWGLGCDFPRTRATAVTALAQSPSDYSGCGELLFEGLAESSDSFCMTPRGLSLNLPVAADFGADQKLEGLLYCVLNCTTPERVCQDKDESTVCQDGDENVWLDEFEGMWQDEDEGGRQASRFGEPSAGHPILWTKTVQQASRMRLAVPMIRPTGYRADRHNLLADEYYRLSLRVPMWLDEQELKTLPRMKVYLRGLFQSENESFSWIDFRMSVDASARDYFIRGVYPPEVSNFQCLVTLVHQDYAGYLPWLNPTGKVFVHLASHSPIAPDLVVGIKFQQRTTHELEENCVPAPGWAPIPHQYLTYPALKNMVLHIVAEELRIRTSKLSEKQKLADLGFDFVRSRKIARCLKDQLGTPVSSDVFNRPITVREFSEELRFITRPSFAMSDHARTLGSASVAKNEEVTPSIADISIHQVDKRDSIHALMKPSNGTGSRLKEPDFTLSVPIHDMRSHSPGPFTRHCDCGRTEFSQKGLRFLFQLDWEQRGMWLSVRKHGKLSNTAATTTLEMLKTSE